MAVAVNTKTKANMVTANINLRYYQNPLFDASINHLFNSAEQKGQIYAPTGAGKTVVFTKTIVHALNAGYRKIAVVHPRIALSTDQLLRWKDDVGTQVVTTSFHSGKHVAGNEMFREVNTTSRFELELIQKNTNDMNVAHVTFSSYHSFNQLASMDFDLVIFDEAHYIPNNKTYRAWNSTLAARKVLYFTATPITADFEGAMLDEVEFGKVLASVEPKVLIAGGYIVAPLIHNLYAKTSAKSGKVDIVDLIARSYVEQHKDIVKHGMPYHQMLVAARNVEGDLREVEANVAAINKQIRDANPAISNVDIYTIEANGAYKNGRLAGTRAEVIDIIKASGTNAIVVHFDTLAEGIDISTLSGVVLMRKMSKAKIIQTIGRCARPYVGDLDPVTREPLKSVFDPANDVDNRLKPRCIVTIPVIDGEWIAGDKIATVAEAFIAAGYDELSTHIPVSEEAEGIGEENDEKEEAEPSIYDAIRTHEMNKELEDIKNYFDDLFDVE